MADSTEASRAADTTAQPGPHRCRCHSSARDLDLEGPSNPRPPDGRWQESREDKAPQLQFRRLRRAEGERRSDGKAVMRPGASVSHPASFPSANPLQPEPRLPL